MLNANNSKTVKAKDLKFDKNVPRGSPVWPQNFFKKGAWPGSRDPLNFLALNANTWRRYALSWAPSSSFCYASAPCGGSLQIDPCHLYMFLSMCTSHTGFNYPAPGRYRERGIVFARFLSFFVSLFLCQQDYEKTAGQICMKFSGKVWSDHGTTWFNFGSIRINGSPQKPPKTQIAQNGDLDN